MTWRAEDPQGGESLKIKHLIVPYTRGAVLDIGAGPWKAWPHFTSVDNRDEYQSLDWKPDVWGDATNLSMFASNSWDAVFSSHLLEHIEDTEATLREWWRVIKPGGHLVLYLPHKDLYPNIGVEGSNPDHKHDFLPKDIQKIMGGLSGWDLVLDESRNQGQEYSFLQVYKKTSGNQHRQMQFTVTGEPRCLVIRYGGIGDMMMATSVLPGLKEQGYHVTMQCTPLGEEILRHDPNIDEFWVQDKDQVPNTELQTYWKALGNEFDKVINLCESVEGSLLALPDRRNYGMSKTARHLMMDVNYLEFTHAIAEVPFPPRPAFYPTPAERKAAAETRKKLGDVPVVLWSISGSAVHKIWDGVAPTLLELLARTDAKFIILGAKNDQMLEAAVMQELALSLLGIPYEESHEMKLSHICQKLKEHFGENRVICKSGAWSIRETLAFIEHADVVVGPETGVLNAAAMLPMLKVIMLSHSTGENLTKHWTRTATIEPWGVSCYPCHRMHYGWSGCNKDEKTALAACAASIKPAQVGELIKVEVYGWHEKRRAAE